MSRAELEVGQGGRCRVCKRVLTNAASREAGIGPVCAGKVAKTAPLAQTPQERHLGCRANYTILRQQSEPEKIVWINDVGHDKGCPTVTNDAHAVVKSVLARWPDHRVIYRDSDGRWDELKHDGQAFTDYAPYNGATP